MGDGASGVDERAELGELRRRAYGPDADIFEDAAALERLRELEEAASRTGSGAAALVLREASAPVGDVMPALTPAPAPSGPVVSDASSTPSRPPLDPAGGMPAGPVAAGDSAPAAESGPVVEPTPSDEGAADAQAEPVPPGRHGNSSRMRRLYARATSTGRRRIVLGVGALAVVGLIGGFVGWTIAQPRVDRVLAVTSATRDIDGANEQFLTQVYSVRGPLRGHERYGDLRVWTADADRGSKCIIVTSADPMDYILGVGCAPAAMAASLDVYLVQGMPDTGLRLPDHSVIRFVRSGDDVKVTVAPAPSPSPVR